MPIEQEKDKPKQQGDINNLISLKIKGFDYIFDQTKVSHIIMVDDFVTNRTPLIMATLTITSLEYIEVRKLYQFDKPVLENVDIIIHATDRSLANATPKEVITIHNMIGIVDKTHYYSDVEMDMNPMENNSQDYSTKLYIALFDKDALKAFSKGYTNGVYKSAKINDVIFNGFLETAITPLKFAPVASINNNTYDQIVVPPFGFYDMLKYIDDNYTIYQTDYNVYIKDKIVYLFPLYEKMSITHNEKKKNKELYVELLDKHYLQTKEQIVKDDDSILHIQIDKTDCRFSTNYGLIKQGIDIVNISNYVKSGDTYDFIHSIKVEHSSEYNEHPSKTTKISVIQFDILSNALDLELYPSTKVTIVNPEFGGIFRIKSVEVRIKKDALIRTITLYKILE